MAAAWADAVEEKKHLQDAGKKVMKRLLNQTIGAAFRTWEEMVRQVTVCRKIMRRLTNRLAQAVMNQWYDTAVELKEMRVKITRMMRRLLNAGMYTRNPLLLVHCRGLFPERLLLITAVASAFYSWADFAAENKEIKQKMAKIVAKFTMSSTYAAFDTWLENTTEQRETRTKVKKIMSRFLNAVSTQAIRQFLVAYRSS